MALRELALATYNMATSYTAMVEMLDSRQASRFQVIAIQEPYTRRLPETGITVTYQPAGTDFYAAIIDNPEAKVCFYINKKIDRKDWEVKHYSSNVSILSLTTRSDDQNITYTIINVYNRPWEDQDGLRDLERCLQTMPADRKRSMVIMGDMNTNHPIWSGPEGDPGYQHPEGADMICDIMAQYTMSSLLPPGTKTFRRVWANGRIQESTIDLVLATEAVAGRLKHCRVCADLDCGTDHVPIETTFDVSWTPEEVKLIWDWQRTNKEALLKSVKAHFRAPSPAPETTQDIDDLVERVVTALQQGILDSTPRKRVCNKTTPGFTPELKALVTQARRERRKLRRERRTMPEDQWIEAWNGQQTLRNKVKSSIKRFRTNTHRTNLESAGRDLEKVWKLTRWAKRKGNPFQPKTTTLVTRDGREVVDTADKITLFKEYLFAPMGPADHYDMSTEYDYPPSIPVEDISKTEVMKAVMSLATNKTPGPDDLPNEIIKATLTETLATLQTLFNACIQKGYCPTHFKQSTTVVIKKPEKDNYSTPKSYRPIALLNTLGKVLESIVATRLSYLTEEYQLLPRNQFGGRKGVSTEHALHSVVGKVKKAWERREFASLLLLDVTGAFDNVQPDRLQHNLRRRAIGEGLLGYIMSFVSGRSTKLRLPEHTTDLFPCQLGLPQGSPLCPILWSFYSADLLEECETKEQVSTTGWVDDTSILSTGKTLDENSANLEEAHEEAEDWATRHGVTFSINKYQLIHFAPPYWEESKRGQLTRAITVDGVMVKPSRTAKYLGVILDSHLNWDAHCRLATQKAARATTAISALGMSTYGITQEDSKILYNTVVLPAYTYAASLWAAPQLRRRQTFDDRTEVWQARILAKFVKPLEQVQSRALRVASGTFRGTAGTAINAVTRSLGAEALLKRSVYRRSLKLWNSHLRGAVAQPSTNRTNAITRTPLRNTLDCIRHDLGQKSITYEQGHPFIFPPWWEPPTVFIAKDADTATKEHWDTVRQGHLAIYTDGSGIQENIGASAVSLDGRLRDQACLGTNKHHSVPQAELYGILMALKLVIDSQGQLDLIPVTIFSDSQNAVHNVSHMDGLQSYSLRHEIHKAHGQILRTVEVRWIPAHTGIPGNDRADAMAKEAALNREGKFRQVRTPALLSKALGRIDKQIQAWDISQWEQAKTGRRTFQRMGLSTQTLHLPGLPKAFTSVLNQAITGHVGTKQFLHRIGVLDSPYCGCGDRVIHNVRHILTECRFHQELREGTLWKGQRTTDLRQLLLDPKWAPRTAKFLIECGALHQFRAVVLEDGKVIHS